MLFLLNLKACVVIIKIERRCYLLNLCRSYVPVPDGNITYTRRSCVTTHSSRVDSRYRWYVSVT